MASHQSLLLVRARCLFRCTVCACARIYRSVVRASYDRLMGTYRERNKLFFAVSSIAAAISSVPRIRFPA